AFNLEIGVETVSDRVPILQIAAELAVQGWLRQIRNVRRHARDGETARRLATETQILATAPFRVRHDRLPADLMEGNVLRRVARGGAGGGQWDGRKNPPLDSSQPIAIPALRPSSRRSHRTGSQCRDGR